MVADVVQGQALFSANSTSGVVNINHGAYFANQELDAGGAFTGIIQAGSASGGITVNVDNALICSNGNNAYLLYASGTTDSFNLRDAFLDQPSCPTQGTNVTDFVAGHSGESFSLLNTPAKANGTGHNFNLVSGASAFDQGRNTLSGGAGILTGSGALFGSASITGTLQTASNITPSTGWGTSGAAGNGVSAVSGDSHAEYFTVTAAGTPTANPKIAIVFPTSFWQAAHCQANEISSTGTNGFSDTIQSTLPTATGVTLTWEGTPVSGSTYTFVLMCQ